MPAPNPLAQLFLTAICAAHNSFRENPIGKLSDKTNPIGKNQEKPRSPQNPAERLRAKRKADEHGAARSIGQRKR